MNNADYVLAVLSASGGAVHTPVQVQKLFFLLDEKIPGFTGGPHFQFLPDDYGPFDSRVYSTLESLARRGLVEIQGAPDLRRKTYRTTPDGQAAGAQYFASLAPEAQSYIERLSAWVRSLSFAQLVSAIYAEYPDMKANSIFRHSH